MRAALFLDRDGVINKEFNYVHKVDDFVFIDGIFNLCRRAIEKNFAIVVITNQAGIGRGYYTEAQFLNLTEWMCDKFLEEGIKIDEVYYCPYHPEYGIGRYKIDSYDRKPNPGMIIRARDELGFSLEDSIFVGDKASDIAAAQAAGVGKTVLFASNGLAVLPKADLQTHSLYELSELLFQK